MNQVERIRIKLRLAKSTDFFLEVFGADSHKYIIGAPLTSEDILEFENLYNIKLPECYATFLIEIGNGGVNYEQSLVGKSAAGPDYGIFSLRHPCQFISEPSLGYLQNKTLITSNTNEAEWDKLYNRIADDPSDENYEKTVATAYSGILQIGYSGCSGYHAIILNGDNKGQVIEVSSEIEYCPQFVKQTNFLDWYENWLDDILNGRNIFRRDVPIMTESQCLTRFISDKESYWKFVSLAYIRSFNTISDQSIKVLKDKYRNENDKKVKKYLLSLLVKFDYNNSKLLLKEVSPQDPLYFLVILHLYIPLATYEWADTIDIIRRKNSKSKKILEYLDNITMADKNNYS